MLQEWSEKHHQQQEQQLNPCEMPMTSTPQQPNLAHHVPLLESARPSEQFQSYPHRGIQSEPEQTDQSTTYQQLSPIMPLQSTFAPDQLTKQHLEEFDQYLQSFLSAQHNASNGHGTRYSNSSSQETQQHSPHPGLGEATQDNVVSMRQEDATPIETDDTSLPSSSEYINYLTSVYKGEMSIGMKPIYENDDNLAMPSTSGLSSAQSRTDAGDTDVAETVGTSKRQTKKMWSDAEKEAVNRHLGIFLRTRKLCGKDPIISAMKADPRIFKGRTWTNIKDFVRNQIRKRDPLGFLQKF